MSVKQSLTQSVVGLGLMFAASAANALVISHANPEATETGFMAVNMFGATLGAITLGGADDSVDFLLDADGDTGNPRIAIGLNNDTERNWVGLKVEFFNADFTAAIVDNAPSFISLALVIDPATGTVSSPALSPAGIGFGFGGNVVGNGQDAIVSFNVNFGDAELPAISGIRITAVPAPGAAALIGLGLLGMARARRRG